jgi:hypothetical protein
MQLLFPALQKLGTMEIKLLKNISTNEICYIKKTDHAMTEG